MLKIKNKKILISIFVISTIISSCGSDKKFVNNKYYNTPQKNLIYTSSKKIQNTTNSLKAISPKQMVSRMGVGINASWSKIPRKIEAYTATATKAFAKKGFKHIRLRIAQEDTSKIWSFLDNQIQDTLDNKMIAIIANKSQSFKDNPIKNKDKWIQWWKDVAIHYKNAPYDVMFDLIVEITSDSELSHEPINILNQAYDEVVTAIRKTGANNAKRIIIFSAHRRSDAYKMNLLYIPKYGNGYLIGEFHEGYAAGPKKDPIKSQYYQYGSDEELKLIDDRIKTAWQWSQDTGIPVWEGAWMPGNYNKGDTYSLDLQKRFARDFIKILKKYNIPHAINATGQFYDVQTNKFNYRQSVLDAIILYSK